MPALYVLNFLVFKKHDVSSCANLLIFINNQLIDLLLNSVKTSYTNNYIRSRKSENKFI